MFPRFAISAWSKHTLKVGAQIVFERLIPQGAPVSFLCPLLRSLTLPSPSRRDRWPYQSR
jgi:hypothetical protein